EQLADPHIDQEEADSPESASHGVDPDEARDQTIDVPCSRFGDLNVNGLARVDPAGGLLKDIVDHLSSGGRFRSSGVITVGPRRLVDRHDLQDGLARVQPVVGLIPRCDLDGDRRQNDALEVAWRGLRHRESVVMVPDRLLDGRGEGALDQVDLDWRRGAALEGIAEHNGQHGGESVHPEDARRLPPELAQAGTIKLKDWRIAKHHSFSRWSGWKNRFRRGDPSVERVAQDGGRARFLRLLPPRLKARVSSTAPSRRCRPVSETKTSSRLTWRVVKRASGRFRLSSSSSRAGMARWGSETVSAYPSLSARAVRTESRPEKAAGSSGVPSPSIANSTMWSPPKRAINSRGEPSAMILPWSMTATRSQSRSASSM